jgi:plastocyanin
MDSRRVPGVLAALAALVLAVVLAGAALARSTDTFQDNVTIADGSCKLALHSVSAANTKIIFHIVNNGARLHGFTISRKATPLLKHGDETDLIVNFAKSGRWQYVCTGHTTTRMKGFFTIRTT